ncbi:hypothetical protein ABIC90_000717 [Variovorax boronicumulans]
MEVRFPIRNLIGRKASGCQQVPAQSGFADADTMRRVSSVK